MGQHVSNMANAFADITGLQQNSLNDDNIKNINNNINNNINTAGSGEGGERGGVGRKTVTPKKTQKKLRYNTKQMAKDGDFTANELQQMTTDVLHFINQWFPDMHDRTYFLPPVHMNKLQYKTSEVGGKEVQEIQPTAESDWRDDEVMQRVLCCLRALTDHQQEPMVVLLQMQHDNYMHKPCYAAAASKYPRPSDLPIHLKRGDFDLLFIHRRHGLMVAEIKSVGWRPGGDQEDAVVKKKVKQAVEQLNKANTVLDHLVSDLQPVPRVTKTLILPNVSSTRLLALLAMDPELAEAICHCFNVSTIEAAVNFCLCSQQMTSISKPADITTAILEELRQWWLHLGTSGGTLPGCTPEVYQLLVARFCGPASTVKVHCVRPPRLEFRTLGHAVQEVGERMVQFALFPEQLALLQELEKSCVYLTGPPGTGKTLMLMLVAMQWSKRGQHVHIVSTGTFSEAATHLLYHQVTKTLTKTDPQAVSRIHLHLNGNSIQKVQAIATDLIAASKQTDLDGTAGMTEERGKLYLVLDEVGEKFPEFFEELRNNVSDLHVWAANYRKEFRPAAMTERVLSACLRSTPTVMRRMETAISFAVNGVDGYEDRRQEYLSPTDGPAELFLSHEGHPSCRAMDCELCGQAIAECLRQKLGVGQPRNRLMSVKMPAVLQYSDVIVIPDYYQDIEDLSDKTTDPTTGQILQQPSGIVRGLRSAGIPIFVVTKQDADSIKDLACAAHEKVAVVAWGVSNGLERKVVVSVGQGRKMSNGRVSGVLHGASRCVSQLVYVKCPEE